MQVDTGGSTTVVGCKLAEKSISIRDVRAQKTSMHKAQGIVLNVCAYRVWGTHLALIKQNAAEGDTFALFGIRVLKLWQVSIHFGTQLCVQLRKGRLHEGLVEDLRPAHMELNSGINLRNPMNNHVSCTVLGSSGA